MNIVIIKIEDYEELTRPFREKLFEAETPEEYFLKELENDTRRKN